MREMEGGKEGTHSISPVFRGVSHRFRACFARFRERFAGVSRAFRGVSRRFAGFRGCFADVSHTRLGIPINTWVLKTTY